MNDSSTSGNSGRTSAALQIPEIALSVVLSLLLAVPFLAKPFHIDDTVVLHVVANVLANPGDPLGGSLDWFGLSLPTWKVTTNPPFLSYYLAPFAWISDYSEVVLHLAMVPFTVFLTLAGVILCRRFTRHSWLPVLFVVTSPGVWVSSNLMRDVPALGLTTLATALGILGIDRNRSSLVIWGSILAGLGILTKYSAAIVLPVLLVYMIVKNRFKIIAWLIPALMLLGSWCLHTWLMYGEVHPIYLLLGDHPGGSRGILEKFWAYTVTIGSIHFLGLLALFEAVLRKRRLHLLLYSVAGLGMIYGSHVQYPNVDTQYSFWVFFGACATISAFFSALSLTSGASYWRVFRSADACFLLSWFLAPTLFSLLFVPFQAVRHLLPAILPLSLLIFQFLDKMPVVLRRSSLVLSAIVLSIQIPFGLVVGFADQEYAECYRTFANYSSRHWTSPNYTTWYVGHWGWKFYADQAGLRQFHGEGPVPREGDILIWPRRVHIGEVFSLNRNFRERLQEIDSSECSSRIPLRTMNFQGASFYAVLRDNLPFKFQREPLESLRVYRVGPED